MVSNLSFEFYDSIDVQRPRTYFALVSQGHLHQNFNMRPYTGGRDPVWKVSPTFCDPLIVSLYAVERVRGLPVRFWAIRLVHLMPLNVKMT